MESEVFGWSRSRTPKSTGSRRFLDGVGVGLLRVLGVGIFDPTPTPKVQLN